MTKLHYISMKNLKTEQDGVFLLKWLSSLVIVWYVSVGLYLYDPYILHLIYWPLHTHDIEIDVVESTVDWQYYMDKLDRDLEVGFLYIDETVKEDIVIESVIEEPDSLKIKISKWIK